MLEYLKDLELYLLITLCITTALSPFCIRNYAMSLIGLLRNLRINQNMIGKGIDWVWLSSVIFLIIKLS